MVNNPNNVTVGKPLVSGALFVAPTTTPLPTDALTALPTAYQNLGYASEDGVVNAIETDNEDIKAWGGDVVLVTQTSRTETMQMTLIEYSNIEANKIAFGVENVVVETPEGEPTITKVLGNSKERKANHLVIELVLNNNKRQRIVVPFAKVTEVGEITYTDGEAVGFEVTFSAVADTYGNTSYRYTQELVEASEIPEPEVE
jgi:sporulation protein YlmC with PRC-barrel domain